MKRTRWLIALLLLGLIMTACAPNRNSDREPTTAPELPSIPASQGSSFLERKSGRLVFIGDDRNIYVTDQAASSVIPLTADGNFDQQEPAFYTRYGLPIWSPDSTQVAFAIQAGSLQNPDYPTSAGIYVAPIDGGPAKEILFEAQSNLRPVYLSWSPDGQQVSLTSGRLDADQYVMHIANVNGEAEPFTQASRTLMFHTWAPNSESILLRYSSGATGETLAEVWPDDTLAEPRILPYVPGRGFVPDWSREGGQLLFPAATSDDRSSLIITDIEGESPRVVTEYEGVALAGWSHNERYIAYTIADPTDLPTSEQAFNLSGPLFMYDSQANRTLIISESSVLAFFWSPDSKRIAYFRPWRIYDQEGNPHVLLDLKVANTTNGNTTDLLTFEPTPDFLDMLVNSDQFQRATTIWSPDSQYVTFAAVSQQQNIVAIAHRSGVIEPRGVVSGAVLAFWSWQ